LLYFSTDTQLVKNEMAKTKKMAFFIWRNLIDAHLFTSFFKYIEFIKK
jgi:hypothetical protein